MNQESRGRQIRRVFTKPYSHDNVERLKKIIHSSSKGDEKRFYAIRIDGEFCIFKTDDLERFDDYQEFIDAQTESVEIVLYYGKSNNCSRHLFYLRGGEISGVPSAQSFEKKLKEVRRKEKQKHKIKFYKGKIDELEMYVQELEKQVEVLENALEEVKPKSEIAGIIREGISLFVGMKGSKVNEPTISGVTSNYDEATVEMESDDPLEENLDVEESEFRRLLKLFGKEGLHKILAVMERVASSDAFRDDINNLILKDNERRKKTET